MPTHPPRPTLDAPLLDADPVHVPVGAPWTMLVAAVVLHGLTGPGQTIGVSVFVDHLVADLDLTRSAVSAAGWAWSEAPPSLLPLLYPYVREDLRVAMAQCRDRVQIDVGDVALYRARPPPTRRTNPGTWA